MKLLPVSTLLLACGLPSMADFVSDVNLGVLPLGDTAVVGTTAAAIFDGRIIGGRDDSRYVRRVGLNPAGNWGNEVVYQFEIQQHSSISITSNSISGDPDFFLLDGLTVSVDPASGKRSGENGLAGAYLDNFPPETAFLAPVVPGTYYLLAEHFNGFDGAVTPGNGTFDVTLRVESATDPFDFLIDLGFIAREGTPIALDTFGSSFDTRLAIYDFSGVILAENDDASGGLQSAVSFPAGLPEGDYYAVIAGSDTTLDPNFEFSSGGLTGDWVINFPLGPTFSPGVESGTTLSTGPAAEIQLFLFSIAAPPLDVTDLGRLAEADVPFLIDTVGSDFGIESFENDTQLGLYDSEGFLIRFNDDIDFNGENFLSRLNLNLGLPAGEYFLALAGWPNFYGDGFFVALNPGPQGFSFGGDYVLNHPGGATTGSIPDNGHAWFSFTIGAPTVSSIEITGIAFNRATNQFTVTWESGLPGPFNIFVGDGAALGALTAAPGNVLPNLGAASVTSPATFTLPLPLQGRAAVFLQVTD